MSGGASLAQQHTYLGLIDTGQDRLPSSAHGRASFVWLEKAALLVMRSNFEQPGPPLHTFLWWYRGIVFIFC